MEQEIIINPGEGLPGFPSGHGPGVYLVDFEARTIRPKPVEEDTAPAQLAQQVEQEAAPVEEAQPMEVVEAPEQSVPDVQPEQYIEEGQ